MKRTILALGLIGAFLLSNAQSAKADTICDIADDPILGFFTSTTLGPLGTTTVIDCWTNAELDAAIIEREAIEFDQDRKLTNPSKLAGYALMQRLTLEEAAADILENGVRK